MTAPRQPPLPTLEVLVSPSERTFQDGILELFGVLEWRAVHHHPLRTNRGWRTGIEGPGCAGFPDIVAIKVTPEQDGRHRLVAAELKGRRGRVEPAQADWLRLLEAAGAECYVWVAGIDSLRSIEAVLR